MLLLLSCILCAAWLPRRLEEEVNQQLKRPHFLNLLIDKQVIADARRIAGLPDDTSYIPSDPREFANRVFHTSYMGTVNSGPETRQRAKELSTAIGRWGFPGVYIHFLKGRMQLSY